jgi:hypothetical protein
MTECAIPAQRLGERRDADHLAPTRPQSERDGAPPSDTDLSEGDDAS